MNTFFHKLGLLAAFLLTSGNSDASIWNKVPCKLKWKKYSKIDSEAQKEQVYKADAATSIRTLPKPSKHNRPVFLRGSGTLPNEGDLAYYKTSRGYLEVEILGYEGDQVAIRDLNNPSYKKLISPLSLSRNGKTQDEILHVKMRKQYNITVRDTGDQAINIRRGTNGERLQIIHDFKDRQEAIRSGRIIENANISQLPSGHYTYTLHPNGNITVGRVNNSLEPGVKHFQIAGEQPVSAAGEMQINPDGSIQYNLSSGTFSRIIKEKYDLDDRDLADMVVPVFRDMGVSRLYYNPRNLLPSTPELSLRTRAEMPAFCDRNPQFCERPDSIRPQ
ncbi:hypothetical protein GW915_09670 [bacterium]|nr:hypothetical protein [bacterium]